MYRRRISKEYNTEFVDLPRKTLLKPDEVALFLGVSSKTVCRWYRSGIIAGVKARRSVRIYRDSVVKLIDEKNSPSHQ